MVHIPTHWISSPNSHHNSFKIWLIRAHAFQSGLYTTLSYYHIQFIGVLALYDKLFHFPEGILWSNIQNGYCTLAQVLMLLVVPTQQIQHDSAVFAAVKGNKHFVWRVLFKKFVEQLKGSHLRLAKRVIRNVQYSPQTLDSLLLLSIYSCFGHWPWLLLHFCSLS